MAGLTREQRAAKAAALEAALAPEEPQDFAPAFDQPHGFGQPQNADKPQGFVLVAVVQPTDDDCVLMHRDGERAEVNRNSIAIMEGLGWSCDAD